MKNILILTIVAIILLIVVIIICLRFQKGNSELLNSKNKGNGKQKECNSCRKMIDYRADVCHYCSRGQGFYSKHFGGISVGISIAAIIVSIVIMVLAIAQYLEARKQRINASDALNVATAAANDIEKIRTEVKIAQDEINFNLLLTNAANDGRFAFFELNKIAKTEGHRFQDSARQTVDQIIVDFQVVLIYRDSIDWEKYNLDPAKASLDDFYKVFEQGPLYDKIDVLATVLSRENFSKAERLEMLYKVITTTPSIRILDSACKLMDKEAKLGKDFILDHAQYAKWWEENRESYNKNPEDQPTDSPDKK